MSSKSTRLYQSSPRSLAVQVLSEVDLVVARQAKLNEQRKQRDKRADSRALKAAQEKQKQRQKK